MDQSRTLEVFLMEENMSDVPLMEKSLLEDHQVEKSVSEPQELPCWRKHLGFSLAVISALCFAMERITVSKAMNYGVSIYYVLFFSKLATLVTTACIMLKKRKEELYHKDDWISVIGYAVFNFLTAWHLFSSLAYIPVFDATVLFNTNIMFGIAASFFFFEYKIMCNDVVSTIFMLSGVTLMCRPTFIFGNKETFNFKNQIIGSVISIAGGAFQAIFSSFARKARRTSIFVLLFASSLVMTIAFLIGAFVTVGITFTYNAKSVVYMIVCGMSVTVGCILQVNALHLEEVALVCFAMTFEVPFTFFLQWVLIHKAIELFEVLGMILILIGTFIFLFRQWRYKM